MFHVYITWLFLFHLLALIISHSLALYQLFRLTSSLPSLSRSLVHSLAFTISIKLLIMYIYVHCYHALSIHARTSQHKKKKHTEDEEHTFRSKLTFLTWKMRAQKWLCWIASRQKYWCKSQLYPTLSDIWHQTSVNLMTSGRGADIDLLAINGDGKWNVAFFRLATRK